MSPEAVVEAAVNWAQSAGFSVTIEDVYGRSRVDDVVVVRGLAVYALKQLCGYGAPRAGRLLGRDPSTITKNQQHLLERYSLVELALISNAIEDEAECRSEKQLTLF